MELELTKEVLILLGVWILFIGTFILFLRGSTQKTQLSEWLWKDLRPFESIAGNPLEKRLYQRKRLPLAVSFAVLDQPEYQGVALSKDIGKGGLCIPLSASLQRGSRLRLSIQLPRVHRPLSLWGEVVWQMPPLPNPSHQFHTGIRFIQLRSAAILTIARVL